MPDGTQKAQGHGVGDEYLDRSNFFQQKKIVDPCIANQKQQPEGKEARSRILSSLHNSRRQSAEHHQRYREQGHKEHSGGGAAAATAAVGRRTGSLGLKREEQKDRKDGQALALGGNSQPRAPTVAFSHQTPGLKQLRQLHHHNMLLEYAKKLDAARDAEKRGGTRVTAKQQTISTISS